MCTCGDADRARPKEPGWADGEKAARGIWLEPSAGWELQRSHIDFLQGQMMVVGASEASLRTLQAAPVMFGVSSWLARMNFHIGRKLQASEVDFVPSHS